MKSLCLLSLLFASAVVPEHSMAPALHSVAVVPPDSREARVLSTVRDSFDTDDGVHWLLHPVEGQPSRQRSGTPYIVTRLDPARPTRLFFATDFLPTETTPRGDIGQIDDLGRIDGETIGVSMVWQDTKWNAHAGLVLAKPNGDEYTPVRILEAPGIRRAVGGPNGTIVAITHDLRGGDAPLITVYGRDGAILAEAYPIGRFLKAKQAWQKSWWARIRRLGDDRFALYEPEAKQVRVFRVEAPRRTEDAELFVTAEKKRDAEAKIVELASVDVADAGAKACSDEEGVRVLDIDATPANRVTVVRTGIFDGKYTTLVSVYENGEVRAWRNENPWRVVWRSGTGWRGVIMKDEILHEDVAF
ncbi:MAG: hypothetical protein JOZ54_19575 [Acidobacteria bacterium]|nr:hypothetical protein [Acidobacteriota bacterium]